MAEKTIEDIKEDFLHCSICLNRFNIPKMLPCIHSFCEGCLEKHVAKLQGRDLTCPICRKVYDLPKSGAKGLQTNFHLVNLGERMDLYEKLTSSTTISQKCGSCRYGTVSAFCFDCDFAICDKCQNRHSWFPQLRSHSIAPIGSVNQPKFHQSWKNVRTPCCEEHSSEKLQFYCKTCSKLICRDCTIVQHPKPDHECVEAKSQFEDLKAIISTLLKESRQQLQTTKQYIQKGNTGSSEVRGLSEAITKEMRKHYNEMILSLEKQLKDQMESACLKVVKNETSKQANISLSIDQATKWVARLKNTQEVTEKVIEENNMWELLAMSNDLIGAFNALRSDGNEFQWKDTDLRYGMKFDPEMTPSIKFGNCYSENDIPEVVKDSQGNFFFSSFNQDSRECIITRLRKDQNYDFERADQIPYKWEKEYPTNSKLSVCMYDDNDIMLALGRWVVVVDISSKSITSYFEVDTNPNTCIERIVFNMKTMHLFYTTKDSSKIIDSYLNIDEVESNGISLHDKHMSISQAVRVPLTMSNQHHSEQDIKTMLCFDNDIMILTTSGQIMRSNSINGLLTKENVHFVNEIQNNSTKIVNIFKYDYQPIARTKRLHKGQYVTKRTIVNKVTFFVLLERQQSNATCTSAGASPRFENTRYVITKYETENGNIGTWYIPDEVILPLMCYNDGMSNNLTIYNIYGTHEIARETMSPC